MSPLLTEKHEDSYDDIVHGKAYNRVFTVSNVISFVRLLLAPVFLFLFFDGRFVLASTVFGLAAASDFVDGLVARTTHMVSRLGMILDPAVDVALMISAVIALLLAGRLPLWVVLVELLREAFLIIGGAILLRRWNIRIPVVFAGKLATTLMFFGLWALILFIPQFSGLGVLGASWLPGFDASLTSWGIYFVYAGLILQIFVTVYYVHEAYAALFRKRLP